MNHSKWWSITHIILLVGVIILLWIISGQLLALNQLHTAILMDMLG